MKKNVWIIMGHPLQLPLAMALVKSPPSDWRFHLVVSRHKYWKSVDFEAYRRYFASAHFFEPIYHAHRISVLITTVINLRKAKRHISRLPVQPDDVLVSVEAWNYIENLMTTVWRENKQIFLCPEGIYPIISMTRRQIRARKDIYITKSGYVHYFLDKLLGLKKQTFFYWVRAERHDHALTYSRPVEALYDKVLVLKSIFAENLAPHEVHYPYSVLRMSAPGAAAQKKIVFFLTGYIINHEYHKKISTILQTLRRAYAGAYVLEIRPHPHYPDEIHKVDCTGWQVNFEAGTAETYLMKYAPETAVAFSHISTSLVFALNLGITCYSYHRAMGFEHDLVEGYDKIYESAPAEFFMEALDAIPQPYEPVGDAMAKAQYALQKMYQEIGT